MNWSSVLLRRVWITTLLVACPLAGTQASETLYAQCIELTEENHGRYAAHQFEYEWSRSVVGGSSSPFFESGTMTVRVRDGQFVQVLRPVLQARTDQAFDLPGYETVVVFKEGKWFASIHNGLYISSEIAPAVGVTSIPCIEFDLGWRESHRFGYTSREESLRVHEEQLGSRKIEVIPSSQSVGKSEVTITQELPYDEQGRHFRVVTRTSYDPNFLRIVEREVDLELIHADRTSTVVPLKKVHVDYGDDGLATLTRQTDYLLPARIESVIGQDGYVDEELLTKVEQTVQLTAHGDLPATFPVELEQFLPTVRAWKRDHEREAVQIRVEDPIERGTQSTLAEWDPVRSEWRLTAAGLSKYEHSGQ